jgi:hypothetical protein
LPDDPKPDDKKPDAPAPTPQASKSADRKKFVASLIAAHGSANAALWVLGSENKKLREKNSALQGEDVDGLVILKGDDARKYQAFVALGLEPEKVKEALGKVETLTSENKTLAGKVAKSERLSRITEAARHAEWNKDEKKHVPWKHGVLADLAESKGFDVEVREVEENGEKRKVAYAVTGEGDKRTSVPLAEFSALSDYHAALRDSAQASATGASGGGPPVPATPPRGTAPGKPDVAAQHIARTYVLPSQRQKAQQQGAA